MNFIDNRTKAITAMALDGLYERSKAISANTVNALTPNYQRKEVSFESNLREIIKKENEKEDLKVQNSVEFQKNPKDFLNKKSPAELAFLSSDLNQDFKIDVETDTTAVADMDGNNVNIEQEMMDEAKTGMQYQVLASLMSKQYDQLSSVIRGQNN